MAFVTVKGTVAREFFSGKGAEVVEKFTIAGRAVEKRWTAWFEQPHGLTVGQEVEVSGLHGDEINSWEKDGETKHSVKRSINKAKVKGSPVAAATEPDPAPADAWSTPGSHNDETPF